MCGYSMGVAEALKYLKGREFVLETVHQPLKYMQEAKTGNSRLMRWAMLLQPFHFRIEAMKGKENVGAGYLNRVYIFYCCFYRGLPNYLLCK